MTSARRPSPEPVDADVVTVVTAGTALWFVAFVVLIPFYGRLDRAGHGDWLWTCLAGWALGLLGIAISRAQRAARRSAAERGGADADGRRDRDTTG